MEHVVLKFLRLDPNLVSRYSIKERSLLQIYGTVVLIGCLAALGIWCTGLSLLFGLFIGIFGVLPAYFVWKFDTTLLRVKGARSILTRLFSGLGLSFLTTVCLGVVFYYQTSVFQAQEEAKMAEREAKQQAQQELDAYRLTLETKYKKELDDIDVRYNIKIDKLMQDQVKSAKTYAASSTKKDNTYYDPNRAELRVDSVLQRQIDLLIEQREKEKSRIYEKIEDEIEKASATVFYVPEIKPDITLGNIWSKITDTAFDQHSSNLTATGVIYLICLILEFLPFIIRVLALSFTSFIKENAE